MTWLAPLALAGLAAVSLPLLVHWLARHEADRRLFPTVRFLPHTPPTSVRRHRLTDIALLALRCAIVAAAAAALAQPALTTPPAAGGRPPRAIVVDTSASMQRTLADGRTGASAAEAALATLHDADDLSADGQPVVIRTGNLREGLVQAGVWLRSQRGAGEVTVISDFQVGAIAEADIDAVPVTAGLRFVPVGVSGTVPAPAGAGIVRVFGAAVAEAAARAVVGAPAPAGASDGPAIVIAFDGSPEFADLEAALTPVTTPAMYEIVRQVTDDWKMTSDLNFGSRGADLSSEVIFLATAPPDSVDAAALIARALRAAADSSVSLAEREPDTLSTAVLDTWRHEPRPGDTPQSGDPYPVGRWVWALVLVLLAVETWVRRGRRPAIAPHHQAEETHARVA